MKHCPPQFGADAGMLPEATIRQAASGPGLVRRRCGTGAGAGRQKTELEKERGNLGEAARCCAAKTGWWTAAGSPGTTGAAAA